MNCLDFRENMTAYLYDELDLVQAMALHQHLGQCQNCAREEMELRRTLKVVANYNYNPLPADFDGKLHAKLRRIARPGRMTRAGKRQIFYAVAATLVLTIGLELAGVRLLLHKPPENLLTFSTIVPAFETKKESSILLLDRQSELIEKYQRYAQRYQSTMNGSDRSELPLRKHGNSM